MALTVHDVRSALRATAKNALATAPCDWTSRMLRSLAELAPGMCIDPDVTQEPEGKGRRAREFLWDLTISSWPLYDKGYEYPAYFEEAAQRVSEFLLIAESELGAENSATKNGHARARAKCTSSLAELTGLMERLVLSSNDASSYVLFGVAWQGHEFRDVHIESGRRIREVYVGPR